MAEHAPRLKVLGQTATAHLALAKGLYQRGLYGQALSELDRILQDNPEQPLAHFLKGIILSRLCDYPAAERSLSDAVALDEAMYQAWVGLAFARQEQGRHRDALAAIDRGLQVEPKDANGHLMRGTILTAMGKSRRAIGALQDALKYNPQLTLARYKLGRLLADAGRTEEAVAQIVTAMRLNPLNAEARVALGDIYRSQRKYVEAVREYRAASEIAPQQAEPHAKIGEVFLEEGLQQEALAALRSATRLNPKHVDSFLNIARIYVRQGRDDEALEMLRAAQEADGYYPLTKQLLAEVEARVAKSKGEPRESLAEMAANIAVAEDAVVGSKTAPPALQVGAVEDEPRHLEVPAGKQADGPLPLAATKPKPPVDEFEFPVLDEPPIGDDEEFGAPFDSDVDDLLELPEVDQTVAEKTVAEKTVPEKTVAEPADVPIDEPELRFDAPHETVAPPVLDDVLLAPEAAPDSLEFEAPAAVSELLETVLPTLEPSEPVVVEPIAQETVAHESLETLVELPAVDTMGDPTDVLFELDEPSAPKMEAVASDLLESDAVASPAQPEPIAESEAAAGPDDAVLVAQAIESAALEYVAEPPPVFQTADVEPDYLVLAKQQMQAGQPRDALESVERALGGLPESIPARQLKAILLTQTGELERSREWLKETLRLAPANESSWLLLARVYEETGQADSAMKCLDRALALDPRRAATHVALGNILAGLNRTDEAIAAYRTALRYDPGINTERFKLRHHWSGVEQRQPKL